ncbi:hypothetical protein [Methylocystis parvus]|uniref:hypothetical protein n=1 Tax=Methylocystis parvus TaxID=134 RepID=UPI003C780B3E
MLRRETASFAILVICGLSACARSHGEIAPAPVPPNAFSAADCRQLSLMRAKAERSLVLSEIAQDHRHAEDRTRTFGVPTPMATIFDGDHEAEVARLKGEAYALAAQLERAGCVAREG